MSKWAWVQALVFALAVGAFGMAVRGLDLVDVGFALKSRPQGARLERSGETDAAWLFTLQYRLDRAMTWEELETRHGLSDVLLEESFRCSGGATALTAQDIRKRQLRSQATVTIVLKTGACSDGSPPMRSH